MTDSGPGATRGRTSQGGYDVSKDKKPAKAVEGLIGKHKKAAKAQPTVGKRMRTIKPTGKSEPKNVLALIAKHLRGK